MSVESELFTRIKTYAGFVSLANTRIHYVEAPQNSTYPYATFYRLPSNRHHMMGVDSGIVHARFQFDTWAETPTAARALLEQLRQALQRYSGGVIEDILLENDMDHPKEDDSPTFHSSIDGIVIYRE